MLMPGTILQNRYHVVRWIGGGGMAEVYLAEDTRLTGRQCAIKAMSPAQLAPRERNWAISAFKQEAQMLARLSHVGLAAVTDFFSEGGNWYLVMDFVYGETLEQRLSRAPRDRLSLDEALNITRQLCNVLEYLHGQSRPVIFRDLKPGNVMLTSGGGVKLIDFGIARFFKKGQTRDTVSLGTPGYAAPEQFGGLGQSDPRTDVYSLGALLHHMVTGHDPTMAAAPFPLPDPGGLVRGLPVHVEAVISRATQLQPDRRYSDVGELRRALFPPTQPLPPPAPSPLSQSIRAVGRSKRVRAGLAITAVTLLGLCAVALLPLIPPNQPTPAPQPPATEVAPISASAAPALDSQAAAPPATAVMSPPSPGTATSTAVPQGVSLAWTSIGESVQGRDLSVARIGYDSGTAVVVVGSIQGDQATTRDLATALIERFSAHPGQVPLGVALLFVPSLNPDGNAFNSRYNANGVDLNRNWDTTDWRSNAAVPGYPDGRPGAGGSRPFSEPETRALRDYLRQLRTQFSRLRVLVLHSSVCRSRGEVYPGGNSAVSLASTYATAADYDIETAWEEYTTSGELVMWCEEEGIPSIDIVIPASQRPSTRVSAGGTLLDVTVRALLETASYQ